MITLLNMLLNSKYTSIFFLIIILVGNAVAVPPTDKLVEKWKREGTYDKNIAILNNFMKYGGCSPVEGASKKYKERFSLNSHVDTVRVIVLLVDFPDHRYFNQLLAGTAADFDSILFSDRVTDIITNPTGSMTDYYMENSYGKFYIIGDIFGWYTLDSNYTYYTNDSSGLSLSGTNARDLVDDLITKADNDPSIDFSNYDSDNDGYCDGLIVIHAGSGAEETGDPNDIWSHKWTIRTPRLIDGVIISNYTINPEELTLTSTPELSPIGVFCHEYGHFIGLMDLYDTRVNSGNSKGLGSWSLMASGTYNGTGKYPAHLDPWSKDKVGFLTLQNVLTNQHNLSISQIETDPIAYRLQNSHTPSGEYWIVENRQKYGFDIGLPGEGLIIYHIDSTQPDNNDPRHYKVAIEQADGLDELAFGNNRGDTGDPFPGSSINRFFHQFTNPNSNTYADLLTEISLWDISNSDSIMTADLDIEYSRPWIDTVDLQPLTFDDTDGDGILEPGETVQFYFNIYNLMRPSRNVYATLSTDNPFITFQINDIMLPGDFISSPVDNNSTPIQFKVDDTAIAQLDTFQLIIRTDSLDGINGGTYYTKTFEFTNSIVTDIGDELDINNELPDNFTLNQNYPNPFNPSTTISYTIKSSDIFNSEIKRTKLIIYNILGKKVKTIVDRIEPPGTYEVVWDGTDLNGKKVSSGVYLYRLSNGNQSLSLKMTLLK